VIAYRAMLDVPRELVDKLAGLLRRERRRRGTRRNSRALSCGKQALLGLVWFRKNEEMTTLAAGFGISRATGYRYRDEVTAVLAAEAPDLHAALQQVAEQGWSHVIVDGKVSVPTAAPKPPPARKARRSIPGTPGNTGPSAGTCRRSCVRTGIRSGPPRSSPVTTTT
jgi:hypothetical protein